MSAFALHTVDTTGSTAQEPVQVLQEVFDLFEEAKTHRRWFHAHPELSFEEVKTAAQIRDILISYGITELHEKIGKTGIVAMIRGGAGEGPCIALRADMDGLAIQETADIEFRSKNDNVMHACGHDGHITGLLIAAKILNQTKDQLKGNSVSNFSSSSHSSNYFS